MQWWMPVCIDVKEASKGWGGFWDCFYDPPTMHWILKLLRPFRPFPELSPVTHSRNDISRHSKTPLFRLPPELLRQIGAHPTLPVSDWVCFAAASRHLGEVVSPLIHDWVNSTTWAGGRVICIGEYINDIPPMLLSDPEFQQVAERIKRRNEAESSATSNDKASEPENLYHYFKKEYYDCRGDIRDEIRSTLFLQQIRGEPRKAMEYMLGKIHDFRFGSSPEVLRNLTKKVYVRSSAIDMLTEELFEGESYLRGDGYCLGNALFSRICWTENTSSGSQFDQGAWAGDRFDVISEKDFEKMADYEEWEDVSDDVCATLAEVWPKGGIRREVVRGAWWPQ